MLLDGSGNYPPSSMCRSTQQSTQYMQHIHYILQLSIHGRELGIALEIEQNVLHPTTIHSWKRARETKWTLC
jgi:hypothetical protein